MKSYFFVASKFGERYPKWRRMQVCVCEILFIFPTHPLALLVLKSNVLHESKLVHCGFSLCVQHTFYQTCSNISLLHTYFCYCRWCVVVTICEVAFQRLKRHLRRSKKHMYAILLAYLSKEDSCYCLVREMEVININSVPLTNDFKPPQMTSRIVIINNENICFHSS